jgi:predicted ATPase/DNA-binding SARP family transcriptional activator
VLVSVLGRARVEGRELRSRRQRQLLAALVMHAPGSASCERLAELVWGTDQPEDPAAAVHTVVSRLRRGLPSRVGIESVDGGYRLAVPAHDVDVGALRLWRQAGPGHRTGSRPGVEELLGLYRGVPYDDLEHVDAAPVRTELEELRLDLMQALAEQQLAAGQGEEAVATLREVLDARPDREPVVVALMTALYRMGRAPESLAVAAELRRYLREHFGLDPTPHVTKLELAILSHEVPGADPPTVPGARVGVREPASSFVGRDRDVSEIEALLRSARIVTVLGAGGAGKTRLALRVAAELESAGRPVVVVELSEVDSSDGVVGGLATAIGVGGGRSTAMGELVRERLRDWPGLLVLDNCEHVAGPVARCVTDLLAGCPELGVLATSRQPLGIAGEHRWVIGGLDRDGAGQLFADRARAVDPTLSWEATDPDVRTLCAALDGMPLALELAAAGLAYVSLPELLVGMQDRFATLVDHRPAAPERHRSLDAVVGWSYRRLDPADQDVFDRLGVFAGTFTVEDACAVAGDAAARSLPRLVDTCMVARVRDQVPARFELLETLREYARRRRAGETESDRSRHAAWVLDVATTAEQALLGPDEDAWSQRLLLGMASLRQAYRWLAEREEDEARIRLVASLVMWGWQRDQVEVLAWAEQTAADARADGPDLEVLQAAAAAVAGSRSPDLGRATTWARRAVERSADASGAAGALAHYAAAECALYDGRHAEAAELGAAAFEGGSAAGAPVTAFFGGVDAALGFSYAGQAARAEGWIDTLGHLAGELRSPAAAAWVQYVQGEHLARDDPGGALLALQGSLAGIDRHVHPFLTAVAELTRATTAVRSGSEWADLGVLADLLVQWEQAEAWTQAATGLRNAADLLERHDRPREAATLLAAVRASAGAPGADGRLVADVLARLRSVMPAVALREATQRGESLSLEQAVVLAVDALRSTSPVDREVTAT